MQGESQCPACEGHSTTILIDGLLHTYVNNGVPATWKTWKYDLVECGTCRLAWVSPTPADDLIATFYPPDYSCYKLNSTDGRSIKYRIAKARFARHNSTGGLVKSAAGMFAELATGRTVTYSLGVPLQLPYTARIFDLGYGSGGWMLSMAQAGYTNLWCYDIEANASRAADLQRHGVRLSSGNFLQNDYPVESFDCIRLEHVFEHLSRPIEVLKRCHQLLKPGGLLVMTFPSRDSWSFERHQSTVLTWTCPGICFTIPRNPLT